jgi:putative SOS response-associated peptidase YedK
MCGRYTLTVTVRDLEEILPGLEAEGDLAPRYNIAPTQDVAVVANDAPRRLVRVRWGLVPRWAKDASIGNKLINARAETLGEKPSFREAFRKRRCLVLADGFYEWRKAEGSTKKQPVHVTLRARRAFGMAGLWEEWRSPEGPLRSCAIITTAANDALRALHDRMPVILSLEAQDAWLAAEPRTPEQLAPLLVPTSEALELREVSTRVNSPMHDGPDCLENA